MYVDTAAYTLLETGAPVMRKADVLSRLEYATVGSVGIGTAPASTPEVGDAAAVCGVEDRFWVPLADIAIDEDAPAAAAAPPPLNDNEVVRP